MLALELFCQYILSQAVLVKKKTVSPRLRDTGKVRFHPPRSVANRYCRAYLLLFLDYD